MSYNHDSGTNVNCTADFTKVHPAFLELARAFSSVKIMGPPMSDKLVELVAHLFSSEEAEICKALTFLYPRSAETISRICKRSINDILPILKSMGKRRIIHETEGKFMLYPLIPGIFEYVFMTGQKTPWHKKYSELLNDLFGTGYIAEYLTRELDAIKNIPIQHIIENKNYVIDEDLMSNMLDAHNHFAVLNYCPCRHSKKLIGHNCRRAAPEDGCLVIGNFSKQTVANGNGRAVSRSAMYDIVAERWEKKLVFLTANVDPTVQNVICTCCDCCCHMLQTANHFSNNFLAAPHYIVKVDDSLCTDCGKCAHVCNTHAHSYTDRLHCYSEERCIGCGNCIDVCKRNAIKLVENPSFKKPPNGYIKLLLKMMPSITVMGLKIKFSRFFKERY
jgi:NAD-dependent dihydropyrimidine dehydrogenase PreA subunit